MLALDWPSSGRRTRRGLMSWVSQAQYEGQKMTVEGGVFSRCLPARRTTPRGTPSRICFRCSAHPDQLDYVMADFDARADDAINEVLRFEPPLMHFRRTALAATNWPARPSKAGDKVVLWYLSGNRDAEVFADPDTFDVSRGAKENPHQAFGGGAARTTAWAATSASRCSS